MVIGKRARAAREQAKPPLHIFGYTCINDVTAVELLNKDANFAQWTRQELRYLRRVWPGDRNRHRSGRAYHSHRSQWPGRQNYAVSDMVFSPAQLVSRISRDMTWEPGDVIAYVGRRSVWDR